MQIPRTTELFDVQPQLAKYYLFMNFAEDCRITVHRFTDEEATAIKKLVFAKPLAEFGSGHGAVLSFSGPYNSLEDAIAAAELKSAPV